jgi:ubiquitin-conjugating enzyme E2 O
MWIRFLQHFEDFIAGHFRKYGRNVLVACKAYLDGAQVGCLVGNGVQDVDEGDKSCSLKFKTSLKRLFEELLKELAVKGADCDKFLPEKAKCLAASASTSASTSTSTSRAVRVDATSASRAARKETLMRLYGK